MIVGCYTLDLYCRHEGLRIYYPFQQSQPAPPCPVGWHMPEEFPHQFNAQTGRECRAQASKRGWTFANGDATCPRCSKATKEAK